MSSKEGPMRLTIATVGRLKYGPERQLIERYSDLLGGLGRSCGFAPLNIIELPEARASQPAMRRQDEAQRLVDATSAAGCRVLLDERGSEMTSEKLSTFLGNERDGGTREIALLIGGADGHGDLARALAQKTLALSQFTLPHGLARIVLAEQLYRAVTILAGHPYHRA